MRLKSWLFVLLAFAVFSSGVTYLCLAAKFVYFHPETLDRFEVVNDRVVLNRQALAERLQREQSAEQPVSTDVRGPRASVRQATYDFGEMTPHEDGARVFIIDNVGDETLELKAGDTSCKCTFADLPEASIAPGESGRMLLSWNTGQAVERYVQSATVLTNDPLQPVLEFRVEGSVRYQYAALVGELIFDSLSPDRPEVRETLLFSQDWDDMIVTDISSNLEGLTWELHPAPQEQLAALGAKSGYRLTVHSPNDFPEGYFEGAITVAAASASQADTTAELQVAVRGNVLKRFCLYGAENVVTASGILDLGRVNPGKDHRWRILVRIRDEEKRLQVTGVTATPSSLQARLEPYRPENGLYYLHLHVPADAEHCMHLGLNELGSLRLEIDHPRIESQEFPVRLAVSPLAR